MVSRLPRSYESWQRFWGAPLGIITIVALMIGGAALLWPGRPAELGWLPWVFVFACPVLHVFGHHGHSARPDAERHDDRSDHRPGRPGLE